MHARVCVCVWNGSIPAEAGINMYTVFESNGFDNTVCATLDTHYDYINFLANDCTELDGWIDIRPYMKQNPNICQELYLDVNV